jgi:para-aminobenzoate synthetase component 1
MISTVACDLPDGIRFEDVIAAMFPMGSMTGAPKRNAVKFSDEAEEFSREIYSGSVGYITPEGDFDFNVVIRSLAYYPATKYLSCAVGSAITMASDPLEEYEECVAKIGKIIQFNHD